MSAVDLVPGSVFAGDFRVGRVIGEGGMGRVYEVEQLSTGHARALKVMRPELLGQEALRRRFVQEARIGARIESEHVVEVVAAGVDPETSLPWMAMELLDGQTLTSAIRRRGGLDTAAAAEVFVQLCHGVGAAHEAGVVHRDLKPDNVFLARTRREGASVMVKVLDLGIAKLVADAQHGHTETIGTPLWMAPEQTEAGQDVTPRTDVWALGLIVFTMLTGKFFWRAAEGTKSSQAALLREIVVTPLPSASARAEELGVAARLPRGFDAWFSRCVARDPGARFPDAYAARDALSPALGLPRSSGRSGGRAPPKSSADPLARTVRSDPQPPAHGSTTGPVSSDEVGDDDPAKARAAPAANARRRDARTRGLSIGVALGVVLVAGALGWRWRARRDAGPTTTAGPALEAGVGPSPTEPAEGRIVTETPLEIRWSDPAGPAAHEIEIERLGPGSAPKTFRFPAEVSYAMWPWPGIAAEPGRHRFRVRRAVPEGPFGPPRTFEFYRSMLDRVADQKTLRVGMEVTYHEPFVFYDPGKQAVVGFDVDLASRLAEDLGGRLERVHVEWGKLFPSLEAHELDAVISAVSITDERRLRYGFSAPYLSTGQRVVTLAGTTRHFEVGGGGFALGFQSQTTAEAAAGKLFGKASQRPFPTLDSVFAALSKGDIDALLCDEVIARGRPELRDGRYRLDGEALTRESYGVMLPHGDERLRARVDEVLAGLEASGFLRGLRDRYGIVWSTRSPSAPLGSGPSK